MSSATGNRPPDWVGPIILPRSGLHNVHLEIQMLQHVVLERSEPPPYDVRMTAVHSYASPYLHRYIRCDLCAHSHPTCYHMCMVSDTENIMGLCDHRTASTVLQPSSCDLLLQAQPISVYATSVLPTRPSRKSYQLRRGLRALPVSKRLTASHHILVELVPATLSVPAFLPPFSF